MQLPDETIALFQSLFLLEHDSTPDSGKMLKFRRKHWPQAETELLIRGLSVLLYEELLVITCRGQTRDTHYFHPD